MATINEEEKSTHLDSQFCLAIYLTSELTELGAKAGNLYSEWGGIEFGNTWSSGIARANEIVNKNPEYTCILIDRMNRKKPLEINQTTK